MSGGARGYPAYRDSGLPWLGRIPAHWEVRRLKHLLREVDERSQDGTETHLSMSQKHGLVPSESLSGKSLQSESYAGGKLCSAGDLVLNRLKAHLGVFARAPQSGVVSPDYAVFRPVGGADVLYCEALLKTPSAVAELRRRTRGIVEGFWRLYSPDLLSLRVPVPPLDEQRAIADYLDAQRRLGKQFERAKRRLLKLLDDQAHAIVERHLPAVAPVPLRRVADVRLSGVDKHTHAGEQPVRLCNYVDVYRRDWIDESVPFMAATATPEEVARFTIRRGDVLITKDSESWTDIGVPALVTADLPDIVCGYHLALIRPDPGQLHGEYLFRVLGAPSVAQWLHRRANGVTRFGLSQHAIKSVPVPLPSLDAQRAACAAISDALAPLDAARARIARELALVAEYQTRLVSDVVMGQRDVRDGAAPAVPGPAPSGDVFEPDFGEDSLDDADEALALDPVTSDAD